MAKVTEKLTKTKIPLTTIKARRILARYLNAVIYADDDMNYLFQNEAFLHQFRKADAKVQNEIIIQLEGIYPDRIFDVLVHPNLKEKACGLHIRKSKLIPKAKLSDLERLIHSNRFAFPAIKARCKKLVRFKKEPILDILETLHNLKWG